MKPFVVVVVLFGLTALLLPGLSAQDKDEKKVEKKDAVEKKDEKKGDKKDVAEKKDEKKGDEKKGDKKEETPKSTKGKGKNVDPEEEKILTGTFSPPWYAKIYNMDANSAGEFTVQLQTPYRPKLLAAQQWYAQQIKAKNFSAEVGKQYEEKIRQADRVEVRSGAGMKIRTMFAPVEYDAKGNLKRWTAKEIAAMKGASKLPGFPAQIDALRTGQIVQLYVAKVPMKKNAAKEKKKAIDDDAEDPLLRPEVLMIVVIREAPAR